jgi:hypothetical protein
MYVIRNVFRCKPGKAMEVAQKFNAAHAAMSDLGFQTRVMVDEVADFWTVVAEVMVDDMAKFAERMRERGSRDDVKQAMAGYMDLVESGRREVFRLVE